MQQVAAVSMSPTRLLVEPRRTQPHLRCLTSVLGRLGYEPMPEAGAGAPCWGVRDAAGGVFSIALQRSDGLNSLRTHDRYAPGMHHFAFHADSREDVDAFHGFLLELGAAILDPPTEYDYTPGYYAVFFADPDGLKLEVVFEPELRGKTGG